MLKQTLYSENQADSPDDQRQACQGKLRAFQGHEKEKHKSGRKTSHPLRPGRKKIGLDLTVGGPTGLEFFSSECVFQTFQKSSCEHSFPSDEFKQRKGFLPQICRLRPPSSIISGAEAEKRPEA